MTCSTSTPSATSLSEGTRLDLHLALLIAPPTHQPTHQTTHQQQNSPLQPHKIHKMDQDIPLRLLGEFNIPSPSNETATNTQNHSDEAQTPPFSSSSSSSPSSLLKTLNGLPRELRDAIYELTFDEDVYVVLGRRSILPVGSEGPSHPDSTTQVTSRYRVIYPGSHPTFGAKIVDSHATQSDEPEQAEMAAYGASVRNGLRMFGTPAAGDKVNSKARALETSTRKNWLSSILLATCCGAQLRKRSRKDDPPAVSSSDEANDEATEALDEAVVINTSASKTNLSGILPASKQNYEEAAPFLYKSCTVLFEDFDLSTKFSNAVSFDNLKHVTSIQVYHPQEAEGTVKAITAIRDCPDLSDFYGQSNAFLPDTESRLRRALVSSGADPNDDFALAFNIATQCTSFYQSADPNRLVSIPSSLLPSRWLFGVLCRLIVVSMSGAKELTVWIGDTLELESNSARCGMYEAALLQFAAMGNVDAVSIKKWGEVFDNSGDEDARWHEVNWMKVRTLNGVEEMFDVRGRRYGLLLHAFLR
jgi:hypothetical protein